MGEVRNGNTGGSGECMKKDILGVKIDDLNMVEALSVVEKWIWNPGKYYIVTPNPEFVMAAQKDESFKKILNGADLSIPDGSGLKFSGKIKNTFSGTDFMEELVKLSAEKGFVVGFLGGKDGVAKRCADCLLKKYPRLKVAIAESGGEVDKDGKQTTDYRLPTTAAEDGRPKTVDILFVAFGHIKQEKWIANNLDKIPVKIAMGVGGAFDYLSGRILRAPIWIRELGFEWLFRLAVQPWRIRRQLVLLKYLWLIILRSD